MANPKRRLGVVLFQLGGPDTPQAIEPFLFNLFCDPDIIDFPFARIGRKPLAKLISTTRAKKVQHHYSAIGGASPIRRFTEQQAHALLASVYEGSGPAVAGGELRRGCSLTPLSPVFKHYDRKQPERMATPFP